MSRRRHFKNNPRVRMFGITAPVARHVWAIVAMVVGAALVAFSCFLMANFRSYDDEVSQYEGLWDEYKNSRYWGPGMRAKNRLQELNDMGRFRYELTPYWGLGLSLIMTIAMVYSAYNSKDCEWHW